jgi:cellulose synthase/poly-beta-1,6-N-acetylglucosamine synthase-like glycosyltransferase
MANRVVEHRGIRLVHGTATRRSPDIKRVVKTNAGGPPNVTGVVKLSVIVPFFNVQQYAPDTLKSLRANAREDFEFILVDDCSRDETPDILARAERELPGAVYVRHEQNGGLATARNTGIDKARGEYLTFLDGDDWLAPGYYPQLVSAIEELGCDFVRTDHVQCTARARSVHRVPNGRRGVVMNPRDAILPADRSTSVDYAYAWAGVYHRTSPTGCVPRRTGPGSGSCTGRRNPLRRWACWACSTGAESPLH